MSLIKKGLSDSKYYLIANIGNKALAFFVIPILAKTVTVEEFATYDLFLVISSFLNIFIILGIDSGIAILLAESKEDNQKLSFFYVSTLLISLSIIFFMVIAFGFIFIYTDELFLLSKDIWGYIGFYVLFNMINYHTFNFLRWRERAKQASFVTLFSYISGMLIGLYFLYLEKSVESYIQGLVIGLSLGSIISLYISKDYILGFKIIKDAKEQLKELFQLSLPFVPDYLGNSLIQMADRVVILMLFGKYELGLYAVITKLAMIPQIIIGTVTGGFLPVMFRNYKTEKGKNLIKNFFHIYLILIPIAFLITYPIASWAVELFAGSEYVKMSYLFPMALVSILFIQSSQANGFGFSIKRKTHYIMYITFLAVIINYIFSFIFGHWIGLEGVIIGTLVAGILKTYFYTLFSERLYSFGYSYRLIMFISFLCLIFVIFNEKVF
ncbi:polysaccharide biosynthesis protein [hydrothermal vent metagenome]|uniref:Polysaccharide biosynthesis protein n=1 Tax=hydrothermal vent metagenome TaxID=652676 RepID=A0A1W1BUU5_9ZZZZ